MSISQALATSLTGLRTTQAGLALVASNVANAQTPGYSRQRLDLARDLNRTSREIYRFKHNVR